MVMAVTAHLHPATVLPKPHHPAMALRLPDLEETEMAKEDLTVTDMVTVMDVEMAMEMV